MSILEAMRTRVDETVERLAAMEFKSDPIAVQSPRDKLAGYTL